MKINLFFENAKLFYNVYEASSLDGYRINNRQKKDFEK